MESVMFVKMSFVVIMMMMGTSEALKYYVGGKEGWSLKPSKTFNHWASNNRFQLNDSLVFRYKNGTDSVLQVDEDDYKTCKKSNPILSLENKGESSSFNLNHSGLFYFISGHADNCEKGQKIIILVMAPRNYTHTTPTPAPSSSLLTPAPAVSSESEQPFSPGPSEAPPPEDGKSAAAPASGGGLVMLVGVLLFWTVYY